MLWRSSAPTRRPPGFVEPCLPTVGETVPSGSQWVHEIKHDGFRFICRRDGNRVRVFSRNGNDYADRVPRIADALWAVRVKSVTIDGEGVICDGQGISNFDTLRAAMAGAGSRQAFLYAFDLLEFNGRDLRDLPWDARRKALIAVLRNGELGIRLSEHVEGCDGDVVFQSACRMGLEGIVAKRRDRPYRSGRSPDWVKVKNPDAPAATRVIEW
jgi:bifunctional non-homologous end joining protein LigD